MLPRPFGLSSLLRVRCETFRIQEDQLAEYLIPVPVSLRLFPGYISARQIQHFLQRTVTQKYTLCFCHLPVLAVQPFYDVCGIHDPADVP